MVSAEFADESRAGSLTLIGGELALDFANTSSARGWPTCQEHLRSAVNVVDWPGHARVLPPDHAAGRGAPSDRMQNLTRTHAHCLAKAYLAPFGGRFVWSWPVRLASIEA